MFDARFLLIQYAVGTVVFATLIERDLRSEHCRGEAERPEGAWAVLLSLSTAASLVALAHAVCASTLHLIALGDAFARGRAFDPVPRLLMLALAVAASGVGMTSNALHRDRHLFGRLVRARAAAGEAFHGPAAGVGKPKRGIDRDLD